MESQAKNNKYPAAMRAAHPAAAEALPNPGCPGVGGGHDCSFHRSHAVQRPGGVATASVERRERAAHAHDALVDLVEAVEAEGGKYAQALADGLRESALAVAMLRQ